MKDKNCIICNKKIFIPAFPFNTNFNGKIFYYMKCANCKFVKINPYPNKKDLKILYENKSYHEKFYSNVDNEEYRHSVRYLKKFLNFKIKLLDYGSGNGNFIQEIDKNHKCYGLEYSLDTIKRLKKNFKNKIFLNNRELNDKKYNNFFDVIHLGDVLEHVIDPNYLLINLHKKIKKKGLLYLEGPIERNFSLVNLSIILFGNIKRLLTSNYKNNFKPYHLFFCDFQNQLLMIKKINKFKIIDYEIFETGWPYNSGGYLKKSIALMAILFSNLNIFGFKIGNRFRLILEKK
ncbi:MAG: class I SAM-dependent methyltransferase [Flavobacteriales bacterium TMED235]|nr:MAG: class I SAM-dependent methyltransferase [Flavobacteriales bacterium TMED235]|tara:strand:+ start:205 stop:1074 length:870 start_codon:yes stop_codon:yes gene_type:complete